MASLGFFTTPVGLAALSIGGGILFLSGTILFVRLFRKVRELEERQKMFLKGKNGADLESVVLRHDKEIGTLDSEIQELYEIAEKIRSLAAIGIHKVGIVRFNPFQDTGSNQSWSIALLDGANTGIVISSLLSRESGRVYAKPVLRGEPQDFPLTTEERRAIDIAQISRTAKTPSPKKGEPAENEDQENNKEEAPRKL